MKTSALDLTSSAAVPGWRVRWRLVRQLLPAALIVAVWLSLWSWVAVGVAAPLGRAGVDASRSSGGSTWSLQL